MSEDSKLNAFLGDEPLPDVPVVEQEPTPEPEDAAEDAGQPRDDKGRFAAKDTGVEPEPAGEPAQAAPPAAELPKEEYTALRAVRDENKGLKQQIEALQQQFQQLQQPKAEPPAPPPSVWEDERGWQQHLQQQIMQQTDQLSRINASEMAARSQHPDFQEMFVLFNEMAAQNPAVVQQAMADPHPWGKAYTIAKNHKSMTELGAVDVADLEAKIREKIAAEMQQASTPVPQPQAQIPPSLTGERNVGSRSGPAWGGPMTLADKLAF